MTDEPLTESDAVTRTKTALVLDLADGRTVELTAHVRTPRDSGLRAWEERDRENEESTSQRAFDVASTTIIARDVGMEDDDPIGLLPTWDLDVDVDVPTGWTELGREKIAQKIGDSEFHYPVFEHESGEAWLIGTRRFEDGVDVVQLEIEAGTPDSGIWTREQGTLRYDDPALEQSIADLARELMLGFDWERGSE